MQGPNDVIKNINRDVFNQTTKNDRDGCILSDNLTLTGNDIDIVGLNSINYNNLDHSLTLQLSAKILGENYFDLININTIEQVFDKINKSNLIEVDTSKLNCFKIHSVDFTNNIKGPHAPHDYIQALQLMSLNSKYKVDVYRGKGEQNNKNGIVFRGQQKSFKERCIMYHKFDEIKKDKRFLKSLHQPLKVINEFNGVLRPEMNLCSHSKIREYSLTDNTLISVLNSKAVNPNYKLFQKIKSHSGVQTDLFSFNPDVPLYQLEKRYGQEKIIADCNFDTTLIRDFIKKHTGKNSNISSYLKRYREIANEILSKKTPAGQNENEIILELENLLAVA